MYVYVNVLCLHLQKNYEFLKQCVERRPVAPIQQQWLDSIVALVPLKLRDTPEKNKLLQELCVEVSDNYRDVIVKHTGTATYNL